jgi:hypothetical protein
VWNESALRGLTLFVTCTTVPAVKLTRVTRRKLHMRRFSFYDLRTRTKCISTAPGALHLRKQTDEREVPRSQGSLSSSLSHKGDAYQRRTPVCEQIYSKRTRHKLYVHGELCRRQQLFQQTQDTGPAKPPTPTNRAAALYRQGQAGGGGEMRSSWQRWPLCNGREANFERDAKLCARCPAGRSRMRINHLQR